MNVAGNYRPRADAVAQAVAGAEEEEGEEEESEEGIDSHLDIFDSD